MKDTREMIRFPKVTTLEELHKQFTQFEKQASEGKLICISDLIGNAEDLYIKRIQKGR